MPKTNEEQLQDALNQISELQKQLKSSTDDANNTIAELQKANEELSVKNSKKNDSQVQSLQNQLDELVKQNAEKDHTILNLKKGHEDKDERLSTLQEALDKVKGISDVVPSTMKLGPYQVGNKTVKFNFPGFKFKGSSYKAEDAATDEKLMSEILGTPGQGILREVE